MKFHIPAARSLPARIFIALGAIVLLISSFVPATADATPKVILAVDDSPSEAVTSPWYRYQGAVDSGACAGSNCGPAVVAMAIGYAKGRWVPISSVRAYMSGKDCRGTDYNDIKRALTNWKVKQKYINGMTLLKQATNDRGHPVVALVNMAYISAGKDVLSPLTNPANRFGRYHGWTSGHAVVVTGVSADNKWVIVQDPYVFSPKLGFYSNGSPKGRDRYYSYAEFAQAYGWFGSQGVEITPG